MFIYEYVGRKNFFRFQMGKIFSQDNENISNNNLIDIIELLKLLLHIITYVIKIHISSQDKLSIQNRIFLYEGHKIKQAKILTD